jgi:hypothetical protein
MRLIGAVVVTLAIGIAFYSTAVSAVSRWGYLRVLPSFAQVITLAAAVLLGGPLTMLPRFWFGRLPASTKLAVAAASLVVTAVGSFFVCSAFAWGEFTTLAGIVGAVIGVSVWFTFRSLPFMNR